MEDIATANRGTDGRVNSSRRLLIDLTMSSQSVAQHLQHGHANSPCRRNAKIVSSACRLSLRDRAGVASAVATADPLSKSATGLGPVWKCRGCTHRTVGWGKRRLAPGVLVPITATVEGGGQMKVTWMTSRLAPSSSHSNAVPDLAPETRRTLRPNGTRRQIKFLTNGRTDQFKLCSRSKEKNIGSGRTKEAHRQLWIVRYSAVQCRC